MVTKTGEKVGPPGARTYWCTGYKANSTYLKDSRMERVSRWQEERLLQIPAEAEVLKKKAEEEAAARAQVLRAD